MEADIRATDTTGNTETTTAREAEPRRWTRLVPEAGDSTIRYRADDGRCGQATIIDESYGGISLLVPSDAGLEQGQVLELTYHGAPMWCEIRWLGEHGQDLLRLGCEWCRRPKTER